MVETDKKIKMVKKPRALTRSTRQTGTSNMVRDRKRKALAPGKRISKKGNIYYENRRNRSDVKGVDTPRAVARKPVARKSPVKTDKRIAIEILKQLGGKRFMAMTGANQFIAGNNWMAFKLPRAKNGNRRVKITLNSMDTYDIKFMSLGGKTNKVLKGIYNDQLQEIFTNYTGLYTKI